MAPEDFNICDTGKSETDLIEVTREAVGNIRQHLCGETARASKILVERAAHMHEIDALHLASIEYLRARGIGLRLACFDTRLSEVALKLGVPSADF